MRDIATTLIYREFVRAFCYHSFAMVTLNAHFDGKAIIPDEPLSLAPNEKLRITIERIPEGSVFTPHPDATAALMNGEPFDERDALYIDPLDAVPADFVRKPGSGAGQIKMADDFNDTPDDFKDYM